MPLKWLIIIEILKVRHSLTPNNICKLQEHCQNAIPMYSSCRNCNKRLEMYVHITKFCNSNPIFQWCPCYKWRSNDIKIFQFTFVMKAHSLHVKHKSRYTSTNFKTYKNLNINHHQRNSSAVRDGAGKTGTETIPSIPPCH